MNYELAIVIPAYKREFLKETLESISQQTCQDFTLYIGDDASPEDLLSIVNPYLEKIKIVYKRFEQNLGGKDLVAHWERCIKLLANEEWIWLFSDDDVMAPDCVEKFYDLKSKSEADLYHFNINIIDQHSQIIKECAAFPTHMPVTAFFYKRTRFKLNSSVVEYIFRRSVFNTEHGFQNNDLAWCADDATWIKLGKEKGILTILSARVHWRYSGSNISSNVKDRDMVLRKLKANVSHIKWVEALFKQQNLTDYTSHFEKFKWAISIIMNTPSFNFKEKLAILFKVLEDLGYKNLKHLATGYLLYWQVKARFRA